MSTVKEEEPTQAAVSALQNTVQALQIYKNHSDQIHNSISQDNATKIAHQVAAMNRQLANMHIQDTISGVRASAQKYQTAMQLQKTGEHINTVQKKLLQRNKKVLANLSADTMTAKRVATINHQNSIQARITITYLQLCSIFVGAAIVIMCLFVLQPVRSFFKHSFAVMQILLTVLFGILLLVVVVRLIANRNHYHMLHQERVFPNLDNRFGKISASQCPVSYDENEEDDTEPETQASCPTIEYS